MKLLVQRVKEAKVKDIETGEITGEIKSGLLLLLGIKKTDGKDEALYLAEKVSKLRVFQDKNEKMNLSVMDTKKELLVVSQFTLISDTKGQNRPSFIEAAGSSEALPLYEYFIKCLKEKGLKVQKGSFGNYMEISSVLDGPVTIMLEK